MNAGQICKLKNHHWDIAGIVLSVDEYKMLFLTQTGRVLSIKVGAEAEPFKLSPVAVAPAIEQCLRTAFTANKTKLDLQAEIERVQREARARINSCEETYRQAIQGLADADMLARDLPPESVLAQLGSVLTEKFYADKRFGMEGSAGLPGANWILIDNGASASKEKGVVLRFELSASIDKYISEGDYPFVYEEYDGELFLIDDATKNARYRQICQHYSGNVLAKFYNNVIQSGGDAVKGLSFTNSSGLSIGDKRSLIYWYTLELAFSSQSALVGLMQILTRLGYYKIGQR